LRQVLPYLNEEQRRILAASEARSYGRGGIQVVARATGLSRQTIYNGLRDLGEGDISNRIRRPGAGRKELRAKNPELISRIEDFIDEGTRDDPESPLRWTFKSVRNVEKGLVTVGYSASYRTVARILNDEGFSLQANRKSSEGLMDHPDRDQQFRYINECAKQFLRDQQPLISVDTKKKELVGNYKNSGREWQKKGRAVDVLTHDFPEPTGPKAVPYGIYDLATNSGWVSVGVDADTAEFAVEGIRQWWKWMGKGRYPKATQIMICADSGGSNGYRSQLWKRELQKFSKQQKLSITVCHFPPGTSKWNKIEHRPFSFISTNWRGRRLTDYQTIVNLIAAITTESGLPVKVRLDTHQYKRGIKVSAEELRSLALQPHEFHGEWNYIAPGQAW